MPILKTEVEINMEDFEDDELLDEVYSRNYICVEKEKVENAMWRANNGDLQECLIILERAIPSLKGLTDALDKAMKK